MGTRDFRVAAPELHSGLSRLLGISLPRRRLATIMAAALLRGRKFVRTGVLQNVRVSRFFGIVDYLVVLLGVLGH